MRKLNEKHLLRYYKTEKDFSVITDDSEIIWPNCAVHLLTLPPPPPPGLLLFTNVAVGFPRVTLSALCILFVFVLHRITIFNLTLSLCVSEAIYFTFFHVTIFFVLVFISSHTYRLNEVCMCVMNVGMRLGYRQNTKSVEFPLV